MFLAGFCGLRYSEALSVVYRGEDHIRVEASKTHAGVRTIPLPSEIQRHLKGRKFRKLPQKYHTHRNLRRDLYPLEEKLELPHVTPHGFRHSFATGLRKLGCGEMDLRDLLGHGPKNVTRIYSHADEERLRKWIGKLWGAVMKAPVAQVASSSGS